MRILTTPSLFFCHRMRRRICRKDRFLGQHGLNTHRLAGKSSLTGLLVYHFCLLAYRFGLIAAFGCFGVNAQAQDNSDIAALPAIFKQTLIKPKVIIALDTSESMLTRAYEGTAFNASEKYDGYFNNGLCYTYTASSGKGYFSAATANTGSCPQWSGNYLNWLSMRRIDIVRNILVGGSVWVRTASGEKTRRQHNGGSGATGYIRQGEIITATERDYFTEDDDINLAGSTNDTPYTSNDKLHLCHGRIVVTKGNTLQTHTQLDAHCGASKPLPTDATNNPSLATQVDHYAVRILEQTEPKGILQLRQNLYDFGVAPFQFDHAKSADYLRITSPCGKFDRSNTDDCTFGDTIYRFNPFNGGTLQPCYPDITKTSQTRTNYDICTETYAGAPMGDLVDAVEFYPLSAGQTAIAETLFEIGSYITQTNHGTQTSGPQFYNTGSTVGAYSIASAAKPQWDPFYSAAFTKKVDCTKVFVVNINDGGPFNDFQTPDAHPSLTGLWDDGPNKQIDAAAWRLRGDCRSDLPGAQDVKSFFVLADLSGDFGGDNARYLREASAVGIANVNHNATTGVTTLTDTFFSQTSNPFATSNAPSPFETLSSTTGQSWDKNGDGEPDNFLLAKSAAALQAALVSVLKSITREVAASSNASVVTQNSADEGLVYQALMYPFLTDVKNPAITVEWSGNVWGLFLDKDGLYREDGNQNGALDDSYQLDPVIEYIEQTDGSAYFLRNSATRDSNGKMQLSPLAGAKPTPLYFLKPVWSGATWLSGVNDSNAIIQRNYTETLKRRRILTATPDLKIQGSAATQRQRDFIAANFDYRDAPWFNVNCQSLSNTDCTTEIRRIVNFIRGSQADPGVRQRALDLGNGTQRMLLGDIANSSPLLVGAPKEVYDILGDTSYAAFKTHYKNRRQVVYVGANDGMLHAFNAGFRDPRGAKIDKTRQGETAFDLGAELWAYVPINLLPHLQFLRSPNYQHAFYVDGTPQAFDAKIFADDADHPGGWGTVLAVTMGLGGKSVLATVPNGTSTTSVNLRSALLLFDITNPEKDPILLDEYTRDNLDYTTATPALIRDRIPNGLDWSSATNQWLLALGSGPDNLITGDSQKDARVFFYDLQTRTHKALRTLGSGLKSYVGSVTGVDWQQVKGAGYKEDDLIVTTVDAGGTSGRLWRIHPTLFNTKVLVNTGKPLPNRVRAFFAENQQWIYVGSGKYNVSRDNTSSQQQRFFGIKLSSNFATGVTLAKLLDTSNIRVKKDNTLTCSPSCPVDGNGAVVSTFAQLQTLQKSAQQEGWYIDILNDTNTLSLGDPSGRVLGRASIANETIFFTSFTPSASLCSEGGNSSLYGLNFLTGTAPNFSVFGQDGASSTYANAISLGEGAVQEVVINASAQSDKGVVDLHTVDSRARLQRSEATVKSVDSGRVSWRELFYE